MDNKNHKYFHLEKVTLNANGKTKRHDVWTCTVQQPDQSKLETQMKWQWGINNGKQQIRERTYTKGLQKRTPWEQALLECNTMINTKLHKGYTYTPNSDVLGTTETDVFNCIDEDDRVDTDVVMDNSEIPFVMLAYDLEKYPDMIDDRCGFIMPKLDGIFAMANVDTGELWARSRKPLSMMKHIQRAVLEFGKSFSGKNRWLVGELYRHGWEFQKISGLIRTSKVTSEKLEISFHVFDLMCDDPFETRRVVLESAKKLWNATSQLHLVECIKVNNLNDEYKKYHTKYINEGYEGIMIHPYTKNSPNSDDTELPGYLQDKRTKWLLKYKEFIQEEYECIGVQPQKHKAIAGSVLLRTKDGVQFSATPKMSDKLKKEIWESRDKYVGQIATVKFFSYHPGAQGKPRFPNLLGFRHPDDMSDCVN